MGAEPSGHHKRITTTPSARIASLPGECQENIGIAREVVAALRSQPL